MTNRNRPPLRPARRLAAALAALVVLASLTVATVGADKSPTGQPSAAALPPYLTVGTGTPAKPLKVNVGSDLSVQVVFNYGDQAPGGQVYPPNATLGDAGTIIWVNGKVYHPDFLSHNLGSAYCGGSSPFVYTPVSQAQAGTGTNADPFRVTTKVTAGPLAITETVILVDGDKFYTTRRTFTNTSTAPVNFSVFHAADLFLRGSDSGTGYFDAASKSVGGYNIGQTWTELFTPIDPPQQYMEGQYCDVWKKIDINGAPGPGLTGTIMNNGLDNGIALRWDRALAVGQTTSVSDFHSFGGIPVIPAIGQTTFTVNTTGSTGNGTVTVSGQTSSNGNDYTFNQGSTATFTASPAVSNYHIGWFLSGDWNGWGATRTILVSANGGGASALAAPSVSAIFAPIPAFSDVTGTDELAVAIRQLAARGIIKGYSADTCADRGLAAPCFGPADPILRAQMGALITRSMPGGTAPGAAVDPGNTQSGPGVGPVTWATESHGNAFADQSGVDPDLWRNVGTMQYYGVAKGFSATEYGPLDNVINAQTISFVTRAMVKKGYWTQQPADPTLYGGTVPASHQQDVTTYRFYVGSIPGADASPGYWLDQTNRALFARLLWLALDQYWTPQH